MRALAAAVPLGILTRLGETIERCSEDGRSKVQEPTRCH